MFNKIITYLFLTCVVLTVSIYCTEEKTFIDCFVKNYTTVQWNIGFHNVARMEPAVTDRFKQNPLEALIILHVKESDKQIDFEFLGNNSNVARDTLWDKYEKCKITLGLAQQNLLLRINDRVIGKVNRKHMMNLFSHIMPPPQSSDVFLVRVQYLLMGKQCQNMVKALSYDPNIQDTLLTMGTFQITLFKKYEKDTPEDLFISTRPYNQRGVFDLTPISDKDQYILQQNYNILLPSSSAPSEDKVTKLLQWRENYESSKKHNTNTVPSLESLQKEITKLKITLWYVKLGGAILFSAVILLLFDKFFDFYNHPVYDWS